MGHARITATKKPHQDSIRWPFSSFGNSSDGWPHRPSERAQTLTPRSPRYGYIGIARKFQLEVIYTWRLANQDCSLRILGVFRGFNCNQHFAPYAKCLWSLWAKQWLPSVSISLNTFFRRHADKYSK